MRKSIIGFDVEGLNTSAAWEAGFGSLYWMEGVVTRLADRHGGAPMHVAGINGQDYAACGQTGAFSEAVCPFSELATQI